MTNQRSLVARMVATFLALLGIMNAGYLSITRIYPSALVCPTGGGCETLRLSQWSIFPPGSEAAIPVAFLGVAGYTLLFILGLISLQTDRLGPLPLFPVFLTLSSFGALFSIYLASLQLFVIKIPGTNDPAICFWCMLSALTQWSIWAALIVDWRMRRRGAMQTARAPVGGAAQRIR